MAEVRLDDGTRVSCLRKAETLVLDQHVAGYFHNGIRLDPGAVVFDVGANVGVFALRVAQRVSDARVWAFEPVPTIRHVLEENARRHGGGRIHVMDCALGATPGEVEITYFPASPGLSTTHPELWEGDTDTLERMIGGTARQLSGRLWWGRLMPRFAARWVAGRLRRGAERHSCVVRTLSDVIDSAAIDRIDLLKVDCEGAELEVLRGIRDADWPRINQLVLEVHDLDGRLDTVVDLLRVRGFDSLVTEQEAGLEGTELHNVFARRSAPGPAPSV